MKLIMTFFLVFSFSQILKAQFDDQPVLESIFQCQNNKGGWTLIDKRQSLKLTLMAVEVAKRLGDSPQNWTTNNTTVVSFVRDSISETKDVQEKKQLYPIIISILTAFSLDPKNTLVNGSSLDLIGELDSIILKSNFTKKELITPYIPLLKQNLLSVEANNKIIDIFLKAQREDGGWSYNLNPQIGSSLDVTAEIINSKNKTLLTEQVLAKATEFLKSKNSNDQFFERSDSVFTTSQLKKAGLLSFTGEARLLEVLNSLIKSKSTLSETDCRNLIYITWAFINENNLPDRKFEPRTKTSASVINEIKETQPEARVILKNSSGSLNIDKKIIYKPLSYIDPLQNRQILSEEANGFTVILKTLNDENIKYRIDEKLGPYISEIESYSTSGWVLFHNGELWTRGMKAIKIKNNDIIEFYESSALRGKRSYLFSVIMLVFALAIVGIFIWKRK